MSLSLFAFKFIDYGFDFLQNYTKYHGITFEKDIAYSDEECCKADFYYIEGKESYPVYVNIHGGGFIAGDKKHRRSYSAFMAEQGMFTMNINYGLCPKYRFPAFILHAVKALNYLITVKDKYKLDLNNIFVGGDSAGGYISSMLGAVQSCDELRAKLNLPPLEVKIKGLIMICGSYDMIKLLSSKVPLKIAAEMGEAITGIDKNKIYKNKEGFSNYEYVNEIYPESYFNDKFPISFIAHSDGDFFVPKQGGEFSELLKQKGVNVTEHHAKRFIDIHCYPIFRFNKSGKKCLEGIRAFLKENIN
ncbi:MAG: alpha/beta hydrolase [Christensenellales bacterium]|jgi:acetyl esterase/lipase